MVWGNNEMDYGLKEWWDRLWFEGIMRWTMVWRKNEMDYGLKENEWNYDKSRGDVDWWCHDGTSN